MTETDTEIVGEVVNTMTGELVTKPAEQQVSVFGTSDPAGIVARASAIAGVLAPIVESRRLFKMIGDKKHVYVEGWTSMIALLGVFPHVTNCQRIERNGEICYEARVVLRTLNGQEVGAGEAICSSSERNWANRDEYTIKSMAQTRAVGKACRLSFSWLMGMAGYEVTPVEEMPADKPIVPMPREIPPKTAPQAPLAATSNGDAPRRKVITAKQIALIHARSREKGITDEQIHKKIKLLWGLEHLRELDWKQMESLLALINSHGQ